MGAVRQDGAMTWIEHALWWHVYPLGACGAPIRRGPDDLDVVHRLTAPLDWLDHLVSLGCNGLQLVNTLAFLVGVFTAFICFGKTRAI